MPIPDPPCPAAELLVTHLWSAAGSFLGHGGRPGIRVCPTALAGRSTTRQPVTRAWEPPLGCATQQLKRAPHRSRLRLQLTYCSSPTIRLPLRTHVRQTAISEHSNLSNCHPPSPSSDIFLPQPRLSITALGSPSSWFLALAATAPPQLLYGLPATWVKSSQLELQPAHTVYPRFPSRHFEIWPRPDPNVISSGPFLFEAHPQHT
ncbi:hypothetical protein B0I37DRAFT_60747 [Chaetomium sp. MPI-CAGE-AT-0009]|nr:hypothetical protein B0I37DRAFT_60747 [Chaetomium sp. MPI-CAGE-AT-0009]